MTQIYQKPKNEFYEQINNSLKKGKKEFIVTANPETFMISTQDKELEKIILDKNNLIGIDIKERITGIETCEYLLKLANEQELSLYLFGAKEEVLEKLTEKIKKDYPKIKLLGATSGYVDDKDKIMNEIIKESPDICLVALGIPLQEKLIAKNINKAKKGIFIGVGGSFDVLSGTKKRAPKLFIKLNLEWLYRIITEPKRLKRFWNNNVKFLFKIKKEK